MVLKLEKRASGGIFELERHSEPMVPKLNRDLAAINRVRLQSSGRSRQLKEIKQYYSEALLRHHSHVHHSFSRNSIDSLTSKSIKTVLRPSGDTVDLAHNGVS